MMYFPGLPCFPIFLKTFKNFAVRLTSIRKQLILRVFFKVKKKGKETRYHILEAIPLLLAENRSLAEKKRVSVTKFLQEIGL